MRLKIIAALTDLNPNDDGDWTMDGLPRLDRISSIVGGEVTRAELTEADPHFTREKLLSKAGGDDAALSEDFPRQPDAPVEDAPEVPAETPNEPPVEEAPAKEAGAGETGDEEIAQLDDEPLILEEEVTDKQIIAFHAQQMINKRRKIVELKAEIEEHINITNVHSGGDRSKMTERQKQIERMEHIKRVQQRRVDDAEEQKRQEELINRKLPPRKSPLDIRTAKDNKAKRRERLNA